MRVVAGSAKGRKLVAPEGMATRPTTDQLKEAMFNIIQFEVADRRVLDLFAGSGQLGIEALSRGAAHCTFVDERRESLRVIRENLEKTGFSDKALVASGDALAFLGRQSPRQFDLILLDPPYGGGLLKKSICAVAAFDILAPDGIIVCESGAEDVFLPNDLPYGLRRETRHGAKKLTLLENGQDRRNDR